MSAEIRADRLDAHLKKHGVAPLYFIYGEEPLAIMEARDLLRARAGCEEREFILLDATENSAAAEVSRMLAPIAEAGAASLFAASRLTDVLLTRPPAAKVRDALAKFCAAPADGDVIVISLFDGEVTYNTRSPKKSKPAAKWFADLAAKAQCITAPKVYPDRLAGWIKNRAAARGLRLAESAAALLAELTEGNLFAADGEIVKLCGALGEREASADDIRRAALDAGKFGPFQLSAALRARDSARFHRVLDGMGDDQILLALWALANDARRSAAEARDRERRRWIAFLAALAGADRAAKGAEAGDARIEISRAAARLMQE